MNQGVKLTYVQLNEQVTLQNQDPVLNECAARLGVSLDKLGDIKLCLNTWKILPRNGEDNQRELDSIGTFFIELMQDPQRLNGEDILKMYAIVQTIKKLMERGLTRPSAYAFA
jgi:hypothetical protein